MEKNTVCLSLEKYDGLIAQLSEANKTIEKLLIKIENNDNAFDDLENEIEVLHEVQSNLVEYIINEKVGEYRLKNRSVGDLTAIDSYLFALDKKDFDELIYMGVSKEQIIDEIAILKNRYDATKEEQDGNE